MFFLNAFYGPNRHDGRHLFSITPEDEDQDEDVYFFNPAGVHREAM